MGGGGGGGVGGDFGQKKVFQKFQNIAYSCLYVVTIPKNWGRGFSPPPFFSVYGPATDLLCSMAEATAEAGMLIS